MWGASLGLCSLSFNAARTLDSSDPYFVHEVPRNESIILSWATVCGQASPASNKSDTTWTSLAPYSVSRSHPRYDFRVASLPDVLLYGWTKILSVLKGSSHLISDQWRTVVRELGHDAILKYSFNVCFLNYIDTTTQGQPKDTSNSIDNTISRYFFYCPEIYGHPVTLLAYILCISTYILVVLNTKRGEEEGIYEYLF